MKKETFLLYLSLSLSFSQTINYQKIRNDNIYMGYLFLSVLWSEISAISTQTQSSCFLLFIPEKKNFVIFIHYFFPGDKERRKTIGKRYKNNKNYSINILIEQSRGEKMN